MNTQKQRWLILILLVGLLGISPLSREATAQEEPQQMWRARLADHARLDVQSLTSVEAVPFTLLNGQTLVRVKALDAATGEIVGATFDETKAVDESLLRAKAAAEWRAAHGALTPALVKAMEELQPDDRLNVSVWLHVEVTPLPREEYSPRVLDQETAYETAMPPASAPNEAGDDKSPAAPLTPESAASIVIAQVPDFPVSTASPFTDPEPKPLEAVLEQEQRALPADPALNAIENFKVQNDAAILAQVRPAQQAFLARLEARAITPGYVGDGVPSIYLPGVTRKELETLAFWPEIDAIYLVPENAGPTLGNARPTQNADLINTAGYIGTGVNVAVAEGERASFANPNLTLAGSYDGSRPFAGHPTAVAGIIKSSHPAQRGLASGATVYSANGSYSDWGVMSAALDWARTQATVINNSWYWDSPNNPTFWEADRRLDYYVRYNYDFVAVASGNFGNGCGSNFSTYVVSPAKGYNAMSVGNYEDFETLGWTGDAMSLCSSFGDPGSDTASPTHAKPEVAAVGSTISSTTTSSPWIGPVGSGTSYASPMVAALAADLIHANSSLANKPEALRAIIMATALHNIEGGSRLSDVDGTGGIVASAAATTVERDNWASRFVDSSTTFPLTDYTQFAYAGERVRFVITWLSNPNVGYTSDPLPADLDLRAYRSDGTTLIASSISGSNSFEIVEFIAPASETYHFRISRFGSWSGGGTWLGVGWWRGTFRISPNAGYSDPQATPLGTHLSVYPNTWSPSNFWRVMGIRSASTSDHDLRLYTASWFDDPSTRTLLKSSAYGTGQVDYIAVDGNHRLSTLPEHYRVSHFSGTGGYTVGWANPGIALTTRGLYGPYTMSASEVVKVFDVRFGAGQGRRISIIPTTAVDLGVELLRSQSPSAVIFRRGEGVRYADAYGAVITPERLSYLHPATASDWLGLVVFKKSSTAVTFYVEIKDLTVFLPLMLRNH